MRRVAHVLIALGMLIVAAYMLRDRLATAIVGAVLARGDKVRCTKPELHISAALDLATVSPLRCTIEDNPIRELSTQSPAIVELKGGKPVRVRIEKATIDQRERSLEAVDFNTLGELADMTGATDQMLKSMLDACESYRADMPEIEIAELRALRGGKRESTLLRFRKHVDGEWNRTQAARVDSGGQLLTMADLELRAQPTIAQARVDIYLGKREAGDAPTIKLSMKGERMDSARPHVRLQAR